MNDCTPNSPLESDIGSRSSTNSDKDIESALPPPASTSSSAGQERNDHVSTTATVGKVAQSPPTPIDLLIERERKQPWPASLERTLPLLASPSSYLGNQVDIDKMTRSPLRSVPQRNRAKLAKARVQGENRQPDSTQNFQRSRSMDYRYGAVSTAAALGDKIQAHEDGDITRAKAYLQKISITGQNGKKAKKVTGQIGESYTYSPGNNKEREVDQLIKTNTPKSEAAEPVEAKATFLQCVINQTNILLGLGMLGLPFVLRSAGWLGGLSLLLGFAAITWRTAIMIGRSLNGDPRPCWKFTEWPTPYKTPIPPSSEHEMARSQRSHKVLKTFPDIARAAFGDSGNAALSTVLYFELFSCLAICMVTMSEHMNVLLPNISITSFKVIMASALSIPTLLLRTPRLISYLSGIGMIANISVISVVVGSALSHGDVTSEVSAMHGANEMPPHMLFKDAGIPLALGMSAYTFSGHATVPSIYTSMKNPRLFESMITVSFAVVVSCCVSMAVSGYYMFGNMVHDQVTISLSWIPGYGDGPIITTLEGLMVISSYSTFTLCMYPIAIGIEELVDPFVSGNVQREMASHSIRVTLLVLAMFVAIAVPSFSFICSLVGLITTMTVAVVFPAAAYVKLFGNRLSSFEKLGYSMFFSFGLVSAVVGTFATVAQELQSGSTG